MGKCNSKCEESNSYRFTLKIGGSTCVYVNSHRVMRELLDKRGNIYSSKPRTPYLSETLSGGLRMALMEYGPRWRKLRKTLGMFSSMTEVRKFFPILDLESTALMFEYLSDPDNYHHHNARFANSVIMTVCFGRRTKKGDKLVVSFPSNLNNCRV
jgi:cytochrome P450